MEFIEASKERSDSNLQFDWYQKVEKILPVLGFLVSNLQNDKKVKHNLQKIKKFLSTPVFPRLETCYGDTELLFFIRKIVAIFSKIDSWFDMKNVNEILIGCQILAAAALILLFLNWDSSSRKLIIPMDIVRICNCILNSASFKGQFGLRTLEVLTKVYSCFRKIENTDGNSFKRTLKWTDAETRAFIRKLNNGLYNFFEKPVIFYPRITLNLKIDHEVKMDKCDSSLNTKPKFINGSPTTEFIEEVKALFASKNYPNFCTLVAWSDSKSSSFRQQFPYDMKNESTLKDYHFKSNYRYNRKQTIEKPKVVSEFEKPETIFDDTSSKLSQESDSGYDTESSSPEKKTALVVEIGSEALSGNFKETELSPEILESIESCSDLPPWLRECQCGDENCSDCIDNMAYKNFLIGVKIAYPEKTIKKDIHCDQCQKQLSKNNDNFTHSGDLLSCEHSYCYLCFPQIPINIEDFKFVSPCPKCRNFSSDV